MRQIPSINWNIQRFDLLPSTNDAARQMALSGEAEGTAVVANRQTAGRGQHGRSWNSPPGQGLYLSAILRPDIKPEALGLITLAGAVAVAETIASQFGVSPDIKWPNDIMLSGKKVCGILLESAIESGSIRYVVLGLGLNARQREFPADIAETATSLWIETGTEKTPEELLTPLLNNLSQWYGLAVSSPKSVLRRWEQLSTYSRNCKVRVILPEGVVEGVTDGLTDRGTLIVQMADGRRREIFSGEVSLRKK